MGKAPISRGFRSRRQEQTLKNRVPPGQYVTTDFPVLSAGSTPQIKLEDWTLALQLGWSLLGRWNWAEFEALPQTTIKTDIHCVTKWSKLDTTWQGVTFDDLLKAVGRRGHRFVRYADDCNIYVRSERAGQRVMESITRFIRQKLKLKVNEAKSAVARPQDRKFLGFSFTAGSDMPIQADGVHEGGARDLIVAEIVDLDAAGVDVAQDHVVFDTAAEIAETHDLPIHSHSAQECGVGDVVVAES
jgi:hypothetical protein